MYYGFARHLSNLMKLPLVWNLAASGGGAGWQKLEIGRGGGCVRTDSRREKWQDCKITTTLEDRGMIF